LNSPLNAGAFAGVFASSPSRTVSPYHKSDAHQILPTPNNQAGSTHSAAFREHQSKSVRNIANIVYFDLRHYLGDCRTSYTMNVAPALVDYDGH
jgi:hypothetical protein